MSYVGPAAGGEETLGQRPGKCYILWLNSELGAVRLWGCTDPVGRVDSDATRSHVSMPGRGDLTGSLSEKPIGLSRANVLFVCARAPYQPDQVPGLVHQLR